MNRFGNRIRELREENNLLLRHLAAKLDMDTAMLSKIERGDRRGKREQVIALAKFFKVDKDELLSLWLAGKVYDIVKNETLADVALKTVSENIKQKK